MAELADVTTVYRGERHATRSDTLAGLRLDKASLGCSRSTRATACRELKEGHVSLDHTPPNQAEDWGGSRVEIRRSRRRRHGVRADPSRSTSSRDDEHPGINKPAGLVVHPGSGNWKGTLLNALLHRSLSSPANPPGGHRAPADKNTSGLDGRKNLRRTQSCSASGENVSRDYLAVVHRGVSWTENDAPVGRDPASHAHGRGGCPAVRP